MCEKPRVVITGIGMVTPLGLDTKANWESLIQGRSGITEITSEDFQNSKVRIAGQIKDFDPYRYLPFKEVKKTHRSIQLAETAMIEALSQAGLYDGSKLADNIVDPTRVGLRIGSTYSGSHSLTIVSDTIREKGEGMISPHSSLLSLPARMISAPAILLGIKGSGCLIGGECASGAIAVIEGMGKIQLDDADVMIAGGAESTIDRNIIGQFSKGQALAIENDSPSEASRPFDEKAKGFVVSEGSAILILENLESALARKAEIIAEIIGYSHGLEARDPLQPVMEEEARIMQAALNKARIKPEEVDYFCLHGTSTIAGDGKELDACRQVSGGNPRAYITSVKSMVGHMLGTSGAYGIAVCALAIKNGEIPPNINLVKPIRNGFNLPTVAQRANIRIAVNNAFGIGGNDTCVVLSQYK